MSKTSSALARVQQRLKAPKDKRNTFGNYNYRSCESILEAAKPILAEEGLLLTITDDIILMGERYYIRATARVTPVEGDEVAIEVTALAREEDSKKGMDASQLSGATSSYARKYALNGLFLIDDTKDADTDEFQRQKRAYVLTESRPTHFCEVCGKAITEATAQKSIAKYGKALCSAECRDKLAKEKNNA